MPPIPVDFYLIKDDKPMGHWVVACRLLEKAYLKGHRVFVFCDNQHDAEYLDELLWTYKADSFVPHNLQGEGPMPPPPVQIGYSGEPRGFNDILLNMANGIPSFYARFKRVLEVVAVDEAAKIASRLRYRQYRANFCVMQMHEIE